MGKMGPKKTVEEFFKNYTDLSEDVLLDLDSKVSNESLATDLKDKYKEVMKKQYSSLMYKIQEEKIDGDQATVVTRITVKDYHKVKTDTYNYYTAHNEEFMDNGIYNEYKYNTYLINQMNDAKDTVDYTIVFTLNKEDDKWVINNLSEEDLEKIHGLYDYTQE